MDLTSSLFILIVLVLLILFTISLALFIRRILLNSYSKRNDLLVIEEKLDKIIDLLEKNQKKE
ncbi:DUF4083 family protein [Sediminibacillus massiliensis]|uniref:DUF4083 family protein n=1 Tax=Sediminibacillus massiliensis TaxID=1926277 RepID=UPI000988861B|nr:DUF4083 family protein [Sediminibacillus massiliensis]